MFETILNIFKDIPLGEMKGWEFIVFVVLSVAMSYLVVKILKYTWLAIKFIARGIKNVTSAKEKCKHIQCVKCGRTLDRCICEKNKGRGAVSRLALYKREHKRK